MREQHVAVSLSGGGHRASPTNAGVGLDTDETTLSPDELEHRAWVG